MLAELAGAGVAHRAGQGDGFGKGAAHFRRRMGVGAKGDRYLVLRGQLQKGAAGVNLAALFAQAGGVEFDGDVLLLRGFQKTIEQRGAILFGINIKFLGQIGVADDFKKSRIRRPVSRSK